LIPAGTGLPRYKSLQAEVFGTADKTESPAVTSEVSAPMAR